MKITEITVSYGETQTLSGHCNVKPSITLTAKLDDGDSPHTAAMDLLDHAKDIVHEEVDTALENDGQRPRYYAGQLYSILVSRQRKAACIAAIDVDIPDDFCAMSFCENLRLHVARSKAAEINSYPVFDCTDGDFSKLPVLPETTKLDATVSAFKLGRSSYIYADTPDRYEDDEDEDEPNF